MKIPSPREARHKANLLRMLLGIQKSTLLASNLAFKGGTYAALRNTLDRFSVDLDFDLINTGQQGEIKKELIKVIKAEGFTIKDQSEKYIQFFLRYEAPERERNTLKIDVNDKPSVYNEYEKINLDEVNVIVVGHTVDTMFANKLVACLGRYNRNKKIAGRDFYDIHHFFYNGFSINRQVVEDLTDMKYLDYLNTLLQFIQEKITDKLLMRDLNSLVSADQLNKKIKQVVIELPIFINDEINRAADVA